MRLIQEILKVIQEKQFLLFIMISKGYKSFIEDKMKVYFKRVVKFLEDQPANLFMTMYLRFEELKRERMKKKKLKKAPSPQKK